MVNKTREVIFSWYFTKNDFNVMKLSIHKFIGFYDSPKT